MSLIVGEEAAPSTPSGAKGHHWLDSTDKTFKVKKSDGTVHVLSDIGRATSLIANGSFWFAQRQAPGTLTTYSNTSGRTYGPDRWGITNENASAQYARVDTSGAPETALAARYYAQVKKITSTGKIFLSQVIEGSEVMPYRGRSVRFQMKAKNNVGSHTLRMVLLQLTSAGTIDTIPATFASAFGAAGTDPTWGTNLTAITPTLANANSSIVAAGLNCALTSSWVRFGGTFLVPTNCKNLVAVIFTNGQPVANDIFHVSEVGIFDGDEEREHFPDDQQRELVKCLRFCSKTFNVDTAPAQSTGVNTGEARFSAGIIATGSERSPTIFFPGWMRAAPTITLYNPAAANAQVRDITAGADCSATATGGITERGFYVTCTGAAGTIVGGHLGVHFLAEAEL